MRYALFALIAGFFVVDAFFLLVFLQQNKNALVFNPLVKKILPTYRGLRELGVNISNLAYIPYMFGGADILSYDLEIDSEDLRALNANLPDPFSDAVLRGEAWLSDEFKKEVPARFFFNGREHEVKVRYRGDNPNHWVRTKRSWQVDFKKEDLFGGIEVIKLIIPSDREYFVKYLNDYRAQKFGLAVPDAKYVTLRVNGKDMGVYYQIEDWSKEFLERSELPSDANLYITEDISLSEGDGLSAYDGISFWDKQTDDGRFNFENRADLDTLLWVLKEPDDAFQRDIGNILDLEKFYAWNAMSLLAGSKHQSQSGNVRLYANPSSGKFETIPWDVGISSDISLPFLGEDGCASFNDFVACNDKLVDRVLAYPEFSFRQKEVLWAYVSDDRNIEDDIAFFDQVYHDLRPHFYRDFAKYDSNRTFDAKVRQNRSDFQDSFFLLRGQLQDTQANGVISLDALAHELQIDIAVEGLGDSAVKTLTIPFAGEAIGNARVFEDSNKNNIHDAGDALLSQEFISGKNSVVFPGIPLHFSPSPEKKDTKTIFVTFEPFGQGMPFAWQDVHILFVNLITHEEFDFTETRFIDKTTFHHFKDIAMSPQEFVSSRAGFFLRNGSIVLSSGTHIMSGITVIPVGTTFIVSPGATLLFQEGASLVSYSPVEARGSEFARISFRPLREGVAWGVFGVANTGDAKNVFEYVDMRGGSEANINGIFFSGMLSVYNADVVFSHNAVAGAYADDGLNVKYGTVDIINNIFEHNSADALDLDYIKHGIVSGNTFVENGNDGIDLSGAGSGLVIRNNTISRSGDKCISVGEKSEGNSISSNILTGCNIGIEVKDLSTPVISNNEITGNNIGVHAYRKKEIFGGGMPELHGNIFQKNGIDTQSDEYSSIIFNP